MITRTLPLIAGFLFAASSAGSHEDGFEERLRGYILENPEIILEALTILSEREQQAALQDKLAGFPQLFNEKPRHGMGDPDAPIRVVEFFDYRCAPCKAMHPALVALVETTPEIRIEMRHLPILSPGSERGARFALAVREVAGDEAYARAHDALWALRGPLSHGAFEQIAADQGLDYAAITEAMESDAVSTRINDNRDLAIALNILGTPAFISPSSVTFGQSDVTELAELWLRGLD